MTVTVPRRHLILRRPNNIGMAFGEKKKTTYGKDAEWLEKLREEVEPLQQDKKSITVETVMQFLKKLYQNGRHQGLI